MTHSVRVYSKNDKTLNCLQRSIEVSSFRVFFGLFLSKFRTQKPRCWLHLISRLFDIISNDLLLFCHFERFGRKCFILYSKCFFPIFKIEFSMFHFPTFNVCPTYSHCSYELHLCFIPIALVCWSLAAELRQFHCLMAAVNNGREQVRCHSDHRRWFTGGRLMVSRKSILPNVCSVNSSQCLALVSAVWEFQWDRREMHVSASVNHVVWSHNNSCGERQS